MMSNNSPIFSIHHFSDYGFDPQIDYFQVLEEARKHKRETCSSRSAIDNLHFKLQKPLSKDDNSKKIKKTRKRWWWKNALHNFFKRTTKRTNSSSSSSDNNCFYGAATGVRALSGPIYFAETRNGSYHRTSGPLTPARKGDVDIPYINLAEFNINENETPNISNSPMPIYLVT